jgi:universal stress protein A
MKSDPDQYRPAPDRPDRAPYPAGPDAAATRWPPVRRILVAVDGSEPSTWALDSAAALAASLKAQLAIIHVSEHPDPWDRGMPCDVSAEVLARLGRRVPTALAPMLLASEGDTASRIVDAAREWPADLVVIGGHARGRLTHLVPLGSVAESVIRHAPCPVTTVMRPPGADERGPATERAAWRTTWSGSGG